MTRHQDRDDRQQGADEERQQRCERRVPGIGELVRVDPELDLGVRAERVVLGEVVGDLLGQRPGQPLLSYIPVSSSSSSSGISRSSVRSFSSSACSVSRWVLTDTYSPVAMLSAPATSPATPATTMGCRPVVAPATPTTMPATLTMPSFAPSTPARSQFSRPAMLASCGSAACGW